MLIAMTARSFHTVCKDFAPLAQANGRTCRSRSSAALGVAFVVIDAQSGRDVTRLLLT